MTRIAIALVLVWTAACSGTTDVYAGSDVPLAITAQPEPAHALPDAQPVQPPAAGMEAPPTITADAGPPPQAEAGAPPPPPPPSCTAERNDCDGDPGNGCETDLTTDREHCGECGRACAADECSCQDGSFVATCPAGRADCDGDAQNGCEVDSASDLQNCGGCGRRCHTDGHDAITASCNGGRCELTCQFDQFETDCDFDPDNGCEAYLMSDAENCGACGTRCPGACRNGICL
jgi:hypothetical protein